MTSLAVNFELSNDPSPLDNEKKKITFSNIPTEDIKKAHIASDFSDAYWSPFVTSMIRTAAIGQRMSVPKTVFYISSPGNDEKEFASVRANKQGDRYIGLQKPLTQKGGTKFYIRDIYGISPIEKKEFDIPGREDSIKFFDYVTRWPASISLFNLEEGKIPQSFFDSFNTGFINFIENNKGTTTSNIVIEGQPLVTYEFSRSAILNPQDLKNFVKGLDKVPKAYNQVVINNNFYSSLSGGNNHFYSHLSKRY